MHDYYVLTYMGHVLDEFGSIEEAEVGQRDLIDKVFDGRVPDFLTAEDFLSRREAKQLIRIEERTE